MSIDTMIGLLLALALVCVGALITMVMMYWLGERSGGEGPPRGEFEPGSIPPTEPVLTVPDFVPIEWVNEAA